MRIVVLAKEVPDTWSSRRINLENGMLERAASDPVPDEINERALENALQYRDGGGDADIVVLTLAPSTAEGSVRKLMGLGADSAVLVADDRLAGADMKLTAEILAAALRRLEPDLVIAGNESTDGRGGIVPAMVAESLGLPILPGLETLKISADMAAGEMRADGEVFALRAEYPAVVAVTEKSAEARLLNFSAIMRAKKKPLTVWGLDDLDLPEGSAQSVMVSASERPSRAAGTKLEDDGTAARQLAEFLSAHGLI